MASTGNVFPTVGATVDRAGSTAWTSPGNVVSDNATDATAVVPTDYLVTSAYGFAIPATATILGVTVRVEASETGTGSSNYVPQLHSDTTPTLIGSAKGAVAVSGSVKVISTNGGATDLWGAALTPAIVNAAGFGVSIWSTDTTNTLAIDFVTIDVAYSLPDATPEDSWWAGEKQSMVAVPMAGAAAALALAVAIAGGFNQNDEILVAASDPVIGSTESQQVIAIGSDPLPTIFDYDDEIVPQPAATLEEGEWTPPVLAPPTPVGQAFAGQDELPTRIDEEYYWTQPYNVPALVLQGFSADEEIAPQAAAFAPDEDYWFSPAKQRDEIVILECPLTGAGFGPTQASTTLPFDEEPWQVYTPPLAKAQPLYLPDPEQTPTLFSVQGSDAAPGGFAPRRDHQTAFVLWPFTDELPQQPGTPTGVNDEWQVYTPPALAPRLALWTQDEEIVPQPTPLHIMESDWSVYTPPFVAKLAPAWYAEDESVPAPLAGTFQDDAWQIYTLAPVAPRAFVTVWVVEDEIVPQPLPLQIMEEDWQVYTPPYPALRFIYLPDPEQVSGTTVPPVLPWSRESPIVQVSSRSSDGGSRRGSQISTGRRKT